MASSGTYVTNEIDTLIQNYPAEQIGLQSGDKIIEVNEQKINTIYDLNKALQKNTEEITLKIEREGKTLEYKTKPMAVTENGYTNYYLGVNLKPSEDNFINHLIYGGTMTKDFVFSVADNVKQLFTGKVGVDQMMGPVGISEVVSKTNGFKQFVYMLALISISLGVTNLLPIPALDGGKILILIIEAIRRKPMKEELEIKIQLIGFSILIALSLFVTYHDIIRIF